MAGLVPAIHVFILEMQQDVDARHKAGHDERGCVQGRHEMLYTFTKYGTM